jgi:hypothetical protein
MHAMHQPAVAVVAPPHSTAASSPTHETHSYRQRSPSPAADNGIDDQAGNSGDEHSQYGSINSATAAAADIRRLSFISFADVVQAEQLEHAESVMEPIALPTSSQTSTPADAAISTIDETLRRSPSPIRLGSSPPRSIPIGGSVQRSGSGRNTGANSPPRLNAGDFGLDPAELTVETMRQALRKTGSGDLSGYAGRSTTSSPPFGK